MVAHPQPTVCGQKKRERMEEKEGQGGHETRSNLERVESSWKWMQLIRQRSFPAEPLHEETALNENYEELSPSLVSPAARFSLKNFQENGMETFVRWKLTSLRFWISLVNSFTYYQEE